MQASKKQADRKAPGRIASASRLGPAAGVELQEARKGLQQMQATPPMQTEATPSERDWLMVRTAAGDWAGKVSKSDWASFARPLADWQIRVLGQAYEMQERLDVLLAFFASPFGANLAVVDRRLLNRQWFAMDNLLQVLRERIAGFGSQS
jgi:hypothetical protein